MIAGSSIISLSSGLAGWNGCQFVVEYDGGN